LINAGGIINVYAELKYYGKEKSCQKRKDIQCNLEIIDYVANYTTHHAAAMIDENLLIKKKLRTE
jgi:hypothetical protein